MTWGVNYPNLPFPTGGQMNPYHQALQTGLENFMNINKAAYQPTISLADAASKLAYARLMGPQFLAKLMGNKDFVANMDNPQAATQSLQQAAMGQGSNGIILNPDGSNFFDWVTSLVRGNRNQAAQNNNQSVTKSQPQQSSQQTASQDDSGMSYNPNGTNKTMPPDQVSQIAQNGNKSQPEEKVDVNAVTGTDPNSEVGKATTAWMNSKEAADQAKEQGYYQVPEENKLLDWYRKRNQQDTSQNYAQKSGQFAGIVAQGEEAGKIRAQAISELGKEYSKDVEAIAPLNRLTQLAKSPTFMNMRKDFPFLLGLQLNTLSKIGSPQQQKTIGDFITSARTAVANTVNSFQGRAMAKEFDFANTLKINDDDSLGVILGKLESLTTFKQATMKRNEIARQYMDAPNYLNEGKAYELANKAVNMDKIRSSISSQLQIPIKIRNKKTGETRLVSPSEWNTMLGAS